MPQKPSKFEQTNKRYRFIQEIWICHEEGHRKCVPKTEVKQLKPRTRCVVYDSGPRRQLVADPLRVLRKASTECYSKKHEVFQQG